MRKYKEIHVKKEEDAKEEKEQGKEVEEERRCRRRRGKRRRWITIRRMGTKMSRGSVYKQKLSQKKSFCSVTFFVHRHFLYEEDKEENKEKEEEFCAVMRQRLNETASIKDSRTYWISSYGLSKKPIKK